MPSVAPGPACSKAAKAVSARPCIRMACLLHTITAPYAVALVHTSQHCTKASMMAACMSQQAVEVSRHEHEHS